jgi:hypothetical protein
MVCHFVAGVFMSSHLLETATIHSLDAARERRYYIALANADKAWQETKASFALSGISLDDDDAERAGRMLTKHLNDNA